MLSADSQKPTLVTYANRDKAATETLAKKWKRINAAHGVSLNS